MIPARQFKPRIADLIEARRGRDAIIDRLTGELLAAEGRVAELEEMASVRHFRTMKKRAEAAEAALRSGCAHSKAMPDCESCKRRVAFACLEFLLREQINGVICAEDNNPCDRCATNWKRVRELLDREAG